MQVDKTNMHFNSGFILGLCKTTYSFFALDFDQSNKIWSNLTFFKDQISWVFFTSPVEKLKLQLEIFDISTPFALLPFLAKQAK